MTNRIYSKLPSIPIHSFAFSNQPPLQRYRGLIASCFCSYFQNVFPVESVNTMKSAKNNEKEILLYLYTSIFKNRGGQKEVLSSPPTSSLPYFPKATQKANWKRKERKNSTTIG